MFKFAHTQQAAHDVADLHRNAFNAAFYELGLRWHWDADTDHDLSDNTGSTQRLRHYLENDQSHLLKVYEADFLIDAIQSAKARCFQTMSTADLRKPAVNWAEFQRGQIGV
ncbi:MAG: hypothetical protein REI95_11855 [Oxalicibacterium faecigallinarum]|uniref:Uncharacterized protein n=1 Tax=Oxalicibacterium faecigallinarum TaxID=573741 RepID=A0A8J3B0J5_9BURK|nr:hypothetical protein [Oxalicibacterium faecigallinarum]MDQ7970328.1 hypothetical protein [Oxalicibacterium faecigallinarum]GGI21331.1 hypothetical protein GCM10008066_28530 [Oxalicibacterium faecigallinarum]